MKSKKSYPKVAPGINYQGKWENANKDDIRKNNFTKYTSLIYDEYEPSRSDYDDKD